MDNRLSQLSQQIIEFYDKISSWEQEVVKESGLSPTQMHAIEVIGHSGELRMKELAAQMGLTTGTITVMVDGLERQGTVARKRDDRDRRAVRVVLSARGKELFAEHHQMHLKLTQDLSAGLADHELADLTSLLEKLNQQL